MSDAYTERLLDLAYGELSKREAREVEAHAATCEACRAELSRIRGTRRAMATLAHEPAPERGERILLAAAREAAEARRPRRLVPRWLVGGAVVAASLAIVTAVSIRVAELAPRFEKGDDLAGASRYAVAPPAEPAQRVPSDAPVGAKATAPAEAAQPQRAPSPAASAAPPETRTAEKPRVAAPAAPRRSAPEATAAAPQREAPGRYASPPPPPPPPAATADAAGHAARAEEAEQKAEAPAAPAPAPTATAPAAPPARGGGAGEAQGFMRAAPSSAQRKSAAVPEAEPRARSATLSEAAPPSPAEVRTFPGCEGEATRRVERDAAGRVVRYVREGRIDGRRLRIVHAFEPDGRPAGVSVTDLDAPGAALDARALGLSLPARADEARIDAPPRCGR
jgi:hypothetical protein